MKAVWAEELGRYRAAIRPKGLLAIAILAAMFMFAGIQAPEPQNDLYGVTSDGSVLDPVVAAHNIFGDGDDLQLSGNALGYQETDRGRAAYEELRLRARAYQDQELRLESDVSAAFPVQVRVAYIEQQLVPNIVEPAEPTAPSQPSQQNPTPTKERVPALQATEAVVPDQVRIPFPVRSLLLTFAYVIPFNFIAQAYGGTLLRDRLEKRGLAMLAAPVPSWHFLLGRALPYVGIVAVLVTVVTVMLQAGFWAWLAMVVVGSFILSGTLLIGLASRSLRELTFLLLGLTTSLSTFLFLPAMFPGVPAVALLSPVTIVLRGIEGQATAWSGLLYALLPMALCAVALGAIGRHLYKEEWLFSPHDLIAKLKAAVAGVTTTKRGLLLFGVFVVPFAMALELFVVGLGIVLRLEFIVFLFLIATAFIEEWLKGLALPSNRKPWLVGILIGGGFFLAEKMALVVGLSGFGNLPGGESTLASLGVLGAGVLIAPLLLHSFTVTVNASLKRGGTFVAGFLHALYNGFLVVSL